MRSTLKIFTINFFFFLLLIQCGGAKKIKYGNPKNVTLNFYRALGEHDLERAKLAGTEATQKVLNLLQTLSDAMPQEMQDAENAKWKAHFKLLKKAKCAVDGDQAICTICCDESGAFQEEGVILKKVDKRWLVHMTKEDLQK